MFKCLNVFTGFSSSIQPHLLVNRLNEMRVNPLSVKWFHSFLTNRF